MPDKMPSVIRSGPITSASLLFESRATMPPATNPAAPIAARAPPVGSSSSARRRTKPRRAMTTNVSIVRLCALQRIAANIGFEFGVAGVGTLLEVEQLPVAVVEGGVGEAAEAAERFDQPFAGIGVARIWDRGLGQEAF